MKTYGGVDIEPRFLYLGGSWRKKQTKHTKKKKLRGREGEINKTERKARNKIDSVF
jgi:hypothetical protein